MLVYRALCDLAAASLSDLILFHSLLAPKALTTLAPFLSMNTLGLFLLLGSFLAVPSC